MSGAVGSCIDNVCGDGDTAFFSYRSGERKSNKKQIAYILHITRSPDKYRYIKFLPAFFYKVAVLKYVSRCMTLRSHLITAESRYDDICARNEIVINC